jgi:ATP-dependent protease ClpP protease subunit
MKRGELRAAAADQEGAAKGYDLTLWMYGTIGAYYEGIRAAEVVRVLNEHRSARNILVNLNSKGGGILDGVGIYSALRDHPARITIHAGWALSIAASITQAADVRRMSPLGTMMIHKSRGDCIQGTDEDMERAARALRATTEAMTNVFVSRCKKDKKAVAAMLQAETWMTPEQAVNDGFMDSLLDEGADVQVGDNTNARAELRAYGYQNIPEHLRTEGHPSEQFAHFASADELFAAARVLSPDVSQPGQASSASRDIPVSRAPSSLARFAWPSSRY